ncbi:virion structural protein [Pectobacterium phage vB_PcaM_CBB]|uniref:Structural protein n=1 Tax=Pectobacterium phage vB_PcaM_CBB TaxID=2772511 RepID=A0A1L2CV79_9CAUD|nr:virion structural protein [Pectobacterium phage vB_PcaM_CBB]AMM43933.1 structural protein [Pectobacterium phage vB_PcaM_CBB]
MDKTTNTSKSFIIRCHCSDAREHAIHICQYNTGDDTDDSEIGLCTINLSMEIRNPWYKRVWIGLKYMFGYTDHMHYMDTMVDVDVLKEVVSKLDDNRTEEQKAAAKEQREWNKFEVL